MKVDIDMVEEIEITGSAKGLCDIFDILGDLKNERQLLNVVYLAQNQKMIDEIYSDFRLSDLGPFSPRVDFDLEILKMADFLEESGDLHNTIYLTLKGKSFCASPSKKVHKADLIKLLKSIEIEELVDLNRYIYLKEKKEIKKEDYEKLKTFFNFNDKQIEKVKSNIKQIGIY